MWFLCVKLHVNERLGGREKVEAGREKDSENEMNKKVKQVTEWNR